MRHATGDEAHPLRNRVCPVGGSNPVRRSLYPYELVLSTKTKGTIFVQGAQRMAAFPLVKAGSSPAQFVQDTTQRTRPKGSDFWRFCKGKRGFWRKNRGFYTDYYHFMTEMVINLPIFKKRENFVQPAEMITPICHKTRLLEAFWGRKRSFFRFCDVCFYFLGYEYTETAKLPFAEAWFCRS